MKLCAAQINTRIADVPGNAGRILAAAGQSRGSDLVVTPELAVCGYSPKDLLLNPRFLDEVDAANAMLIRESPSPLLFGTVWREDGRLFNGAMLAAGGALLGRQAKRLLPDYDVFDERRYFSPGAVSEPLGFGGARLGVSICEDAWTDRELWPQCPYPLDPLSDLAKKGATHLINLSASPFSAGRAQFRQRLCEAQSRRLGLPLMLVNLVGGQDELIFDGGSLECDAKGRTTGFAPLFSEHVGFLQAGEWPEGDPEILQALVLGIRDFVQRCGHSRVVVGLSGGIDSALVLSLAVRALGARAVTAVAMPGPFSLPDSLEDAQALSRGLGVELLTCPIGSLVDSVEEILEGSTGRGLEGLAHQNIQARARGLVLMAVANTRSALVLGTGNKSELAVGYSTMYGDLIGALAPIGDLTKARVRSLARHLVESEQVPIPERTLVRAPSAELAPNQKDEDTLPPYPRLDALVEAHLGSPGDAGILDKAGMTAAESARWVSHIDAMEFKRRQAPPVLRVTLKAFGPGRRFPLTAPRKVR